MRCFKLWALSLALMAAGTPILAQQSLRPVKLVELSREGTVQQRSFPGRVRALQTVDLAFQVGGQLEHFPVAEGDRLEAGDTVAALSRRGFERALRQAQATLDQEQQSLNRVRQLAGTAVPRAEVESTQTQVTLSEIAVEDAQSALQDATLVAPFDALVARRLVANFTTVPAGEPVVRLHDMSDMLIDIDVPEVLVRQSAEGDVEFIATFPGSDQTYPLSIREYEAESAEIGQTFRLTLSFDDEAAAGILPGASAMVRVTRETDAEQAVTVPQNALVYAANGAPHVFVFQPDPEHDGNIGVVTLAPIEIRLRDDASVELVGGVAPGTEIVAAGAAQVTDGQAVRRFVGLGQ
ncbi:MAG: efflux RND transporter periplasmic adaptor subunit [Alphaproteobacteria bacterium]|nr:efflux RND transporter periplasmic adaptor subunit [Alphaproteobacteria bacterium]